MKTIRIQISTQNQSMLVFSFALGLLFFVVLSFKSAGADSKQYLVVNYSTYHQRFEVLGSDGKAETLEYKSPNNSSDQSAVLGLVKEYELKGYKLFDYEVDYVGKGKLIVNAILMR